jgi:hypothetical protein
MTSPLRWTAYSGLAAALVYVAATVAGSLLDPSYSQVRQHVSDLTATGASTRLALAPPYFLYNLLVLGFAVALYSASDRSRLFRVGLACLTANAIAGVMMVTWFTEDKGGAPVTFAGTGHVIFAGVSSLSIVVASFVYGFAFRRTAEWRPLSVFSLMVGVGFLVLGSLAVIATGAHSALAGLAERGPIGLSILWILVVSWRALALVRRPASRPASASTATAP